MPYADNQGIRIHWEVEGKGPPLVLLHALAGSLEDYYELGYVAALRDNYRLTLMDARGHGASDKPYDPDAYRMELRVADVVAVLDDLNTDEAIYLGYSMGGWIGFGIAKYAPERFHSLIIGGAQPYERDQGEPSPWIPLFRQGIEAAVAAYERARGARLTPEWKARLMTNDPEAIIALLSFEERLDIEGILPTVTLPCLLFAGDTAPEHADAQRCVKSMPNATFVSLPGLNHYDAFRRTDLVLPHVTKFLAELNRV